MKKNETRAAYLTRETILKLLSDDEVAHVSRAESALQLSDGDEYIDLRAPDRGVRRAAASFTAPMGQVLPRKAVQEKTWREITSLLSAHGAAGLRSHTNSAS